MDIQTGLSLCGTSIGVMKAKEYGRACSGEIKNYTRYPLIYQGCYVIKGYLNVPFTTIDQGMSEAFAAHKQTGGATGSYFKFTYRICSKDIYVHVLVSLPYNFNHYVNSLSIAITKGGHNTLSERDMYKVSNDNNNDEKFIKFKEFYTDDSPIIVSNEDFCVVGSMGTSHKSEITIKVFPRSNADLAKGLKSELQEEAQNYHSYIREKTRNLERAPSENENETSVFDNPTLEYLAFYDRLLICGHKLDRPPLNQGYSVSLVGSIENYTRWVLHLEETQFESGYSTLPVHDIPNGQIGRFAYHKHAVGAYGIYVKTTFLVRDLGIFLHIMYSMPYNFNHYANKLSIALSDSNMKLKEMYEGKRTQFFKRVKFYTKVNPLILSEKGLCVVGVMGTSHQTEVNIKIYPSSFADLDEKVIDGTRQHVKDVNAKGYEVFFENIVEIQDVIVANKANNTFEDSIGVEGNETLCEEEINTKQPNSNCDPVNESTQDSDAKQTAESDSNSKEKSIGLESVEKFYGDSEKEDSMYKEQDTHCWEKKSISTIDVEDNNKNLHGVGKDSIRGINSQCEKDNYKQSLNIEKNQPFVQHGDSYNQPCHRNEGDLTEYLFVDENDAIDDLARMKLKENISLDLIQNTSVQKDTESQYLEFDKNIENKFDD